MEKYLKSIALALSYLFHPLNIPILGLLLLYNINTFPSSFLQKDSLYHIHEELKKMLFWLFLLFTWIAPLIMVLTLKRNGEISSLEMPDKKERNTPIVFMVIFYLLFFALMKYQIPKDLIPAYIYKLLLGATLGLIIARIANSFLKISLHTLGMGMLSGAFFVYLLGQSVYPMWLIPLVFVLSGLVASARIILKSHDLKEIGLGYAVGFLAMLIFSF
jgi:hypothetical protein